MRLFAAFSFVSILFSLGCTGSKEIALDQDPALVFVNPYWVEMVPGQRDGQKSMALILPFDITLENYKVDSVFFKGYHSKMGISEMDNSNVYGAQFILTENHVAIVPPFAIQENEALVSYINKDLKKRYILVQNIVKGESIYMP